MFTPIFYISGTWDYNNYIIEKYWETGIGIMKGLG